MIKLTQWNLKLLYRNENDPQLERDLRRAEIACQQFAKRYRHRFDYLESEEKLAKALAAYEKLHDLALAKPLVYLRYRRDLDGRDSQIEARFNLWSERYTKSANQLTFFGVNLSKLDSRHQKRYLKSRRLAAYRYFLQRCFNEGKHLLSEAEEKIINLKHLPAHSLWVNGNEKLLQEQSFGWRNRKFSLSAAIDLIPTLPVRDRQILHRLIWQRLKELSVFAENELNAIIIDKKIEDNLRAFPEPYSATVLAYQNDPAIVEKLIRVVSDNFALSHRFYQLKAKLLKQKILFDADRNAKLSLGGRKFTFDQAAVIVSRAFDKFDPEYRKLWESFLQRGQIDVYPKVGKTGGAYCSSYERLPTFVLLNYLPDFNSLRTLAHELGHAFHSELSTASQPPLYRDYSIATAEVASTLFENFVFAEVFSALSPAEQIIALHDNLNSSIATIFRQVACFNFELALHREVRRCGYLKREAIAALMNEQMQSYLGPKVKLVPDDGYFFVYWSHLRAFFYVYSYAFGEIVSAAMYERYLAEPAFAGRIRQFLSAGGSATPEDILKTIGLDVRQPRFFERGLKKIENDLDRWESLIT